MTTDITAMLWDTTPLYPAADSPEIEAELAKGADETREFRAAYQGRVASLDSAALREALLRYEALNELLVKPQLYAHLLFAADSENDAHKRLSQRTAEFGNLMGRELLFFDLEIMEIPDDRFAAIVSDAQFATYRHYLESVRRFKPHTLKEREEQLLKMKSLTGADAFTRLFDELSASLRYRMELDGQEQEFTGEELLGLLHHPDAAVRERAFSTFLNRHEEEGIVLSTVFNTIALDHGQELELRNYRHPMEPTHLGNELPEEVVNRLMEVSEANYPLAQDYFRLKARLLGLPKLKNTDVYAPVGETDRRYTYEEAKGLVLDAYGRFLPRFREMAEAFFAERRIDVLPRPGKSGGAFCMGMTPRLVPYLLLNFTGNLRDVATLAHEMGHGLHFALAQKQTMLNYHAPLPLAETASVFGEMLLTRHLLEREDDPKVKVALLCAKIEDIIATTFRQNVLTRFEERMHRERQQGLLTSSQLCNLWWEENDRLYGDSVEMIPPYRWGWSYISHFIHARFYCYSYTFAELLVLSLYRKYLEEGEPFIPTYLAILESGGSQSPADTVRPAGIDLADPHFWQKGYDFLAELIAELKGLIAEA
ncbi:M3 family oligoendopeptidase [Geobacter pickeringii]|uniref:Oligoendopeptidase F n=1 Tax=Geobacter pickeringii TaxID=345632 RepID=A0A0B5B8K4_9BACT|nr:M3 family oligoendopeptidase [Geobacter pickeringii]AJE03018.1 oligoendopeptidase F [Geobacter pickeringii]